MDNKELLRALLAIMAQIVPIAEQLAKTEQPQRKPPTRARVVMMKRAAA